MRLTTCILTLVFLVTGLWSCRKIVMLPPEPRIEYTSFSIFDTTDILGNSYKGGKLKFYFEDGDGDLGLPQPSGSDLTDTINLFVTAFKMDEGILVPVESNDILFTRGYRIPYMDRQGQNKILKGTITISILYQFYTPADSSVVKYNFYVVDRAENKSNTETTPEIPISLNGVY